ncbi:MAG: LppP/LprE family lipoprotein [Dehalococcoidia bacterium]
MIRFRHLAPLGATTLVAGLLLFFAPQPSQAQQSAIWLDQATPINWNRPGMEIPTPEPPLIGGLAATPSDWPPPCITQLRHAETDEDQQLAALGWYLAQPYQAGYGIKVIPAQASFDGMCRPWGYNYFVFVDGVFAGTIAPSAMNARSDGSASTVNFFGGSTPRLFATFQRYTPQDALCCPSAQSSVQYTIQISPPLVIPTNASTSPSQGG